MRLFFFCLCLALASMQDIDVNPFYVDPASIKRLGDTWFMQLLNKRATTQEQSSPTVIPNELKKANVTIKSIDSNILRIKITSATEPRWEPPFFNADPFKSFTPVDVSKMGFNFDLDPFSFNITDPDTGNLVVDTYNKAPRQTGCSLKYFDKYIEIGLHYDSQKVFGLGERVTEQFQLCSDSKKLNCFYTTYNKDSWTIDDGNYPGNKGGYGTQPFYLVHLKDGLFIGVLLYNSNFQEAVLVRTAKDTMNIYHKLLGGVIDLFFYYPDKAEGILRRYHTMIGKPYLPPFWSLGFHLSRYGWPSRQHMEEVVANCSKADIPLDVIWSDIDYMDACIDFTIDPVKYSKMKEFVNNLHEKKIHWVPIIDAGLFYSPNNAYYRQWVQAGALIKSAWTREPLIGVVWPGKVSFTSWISPYAEDLWNQGLETLFKLAEFDGIWLDMNEASNFCNGEFGKGECRYLGCHDAFMKKYGNKVNCQGNDCEMKKMEEFGMEQEGKADECPHDPMEFDVGKYLKDVLPWTPAINDSAISMTAYHPESNDGTCFNKEYNLHNLWAIYEQKATQKFFSSLQKRPFILTRANFPGSGKYTSVWLGDNYSDWPIMRLSIPGMYNFQLFGMPLVGSDICGFGQNTTEELCARWMQLGAFYPFTRNHNAIGTIPQEPYRWERVATASRNALREKYSILQYYYTKLAEASMFGGSVVRPLFFEFPLDQAAIEKTDFMFLIGEAILVPPCLFPGTTFTYPYFPNAHWYDLKSWRQIAKYDPTKQEGEQQTWPAPFDYVYIFLRGGYILPFQDAITARVNTTSELIKLPMRMLIALNQNNEAEGSLFVDGGESFESLKNNKFRYSKFKFGKNEKGKFALTVTTQEKDYPYSFPFEEFRMMNILGAEALASITSACVRAKNGHTVEVTLTYNSTRKTLDMEDTPTGLDWNRLASITFDDNCKRYSKALVE